MSEIAYPTSLAEAEALDANDPLAGVREAFRLPEGVTYLVGHSLGPASHRALETLQSAAAQDWSEGLVGSWNTAGWIDLPATVGARIARLIGVPSDKVVVCDSVSLNLFKLVGALVALPGMARRIIVEAGAKGPGGWTAAVCWSGAWWTIAARRWRMCRASRRQPEGQAARWSGTSAMPRA